MKLLGPTRYQRLNEAGALVLLFVSAALMLSLISYHPGDPSFNTASGAVRPQNLIGYAGSYISDLILQVFGLAAYALPVMILMVAWRWVQSREIESSFIKICGAGLLLFSVCTGLALFPDAHLFSGHIAVGGVLGLLLSDQLLHAGNFMGAVLFTGICFIVSLYLISTFSMSVLARWLSKLPRFSLPKFRMPSMPKISMPSFSSASDEDDEPMPSPLRRRSVKIVDDGTPAILKKHASSEDDLPPFDVDDVGSGYSPQATEDEVEETAEEIPIVALEDQEPRRDDAIPTAPVLGKQQKKENKRVRSFWKLPPTDLLVAADERNTFDSFELKETASQIKTKFEEFKIFGNITQINPGPVVTTFEFKPEAGIKYSKITTLTEDLCLGLQAESILIERIPGKPTVGIEVPNTKREVISLRQILESDEFTSAQSRLVLPLGKDVSGRIKVSALETMPHLLVAGSTGSGKSVMLNSMIMSIIYKSTPEEVRMIMIDPKRVELGIYEGIPHLLTPVITDPRKATNALRNAVLEMERRLKLLASRQVRNIDQYNKKVKQLALEPRSLFEDEDEEAAARRAEDLKPLPYILILIDELADLMMLERANVEESVARLAQMARAVGMHLVLATQRPSVDVITGLIKANFPARISFRVATRVDSRTILDVMGAEHLLGKGDMLVLPPGSSRLVRMHGAFVTENEINSVVDFWKGQAAPEYDDTYLIAPPSEEDENGIPGGEEFDGEEDPMYQDAVRVVMEMGKASTSTLQRRLRLGYGRAARILDRMQREGIIGPPDGSRPREVLKAPDWYQQTVG